MEDRKTGMVGDVPMKAIPVRMGRTGHEMTKAAAERDKVSMSQYLRESAMIRAWLESRNADDEAVRALVAIYRAAEADDDLDLNAYVRRLLDRS